jgi:predicted amidophosphoribosyltransferase
VRRVLGGDAVPGAAALRLLRLSVRVRLGEGALCGACARDRPPYGRARAVLRYDDASKAVVLGFKHGDRTDGAPAYGRWLLRAGAELIAEAELIVPVPLHWLRLFARRYNQAALLALALARLSGVAAAPDLLVRRRATPSQGRLSAGARRRIAGAFAVRRAPRPAADRRVLLVDDVLTTGATAEAWSRALPGRRGGGRR